jgi:hypothetical protein
MIGVLGVPSFPAVTFNSPAPVGWLPVPATCTHAGPYCNAADPITYMQLAFNSEGPSDLFMIHASVRVCATTNPSATCQPAVTAAGNGHGIGIFVFDSGGGQVFYQDIALGTDGSVFASGSVYVNGLSAGSYLAKIQEYEVLAGNFLNYTYGRQLAVFKFQ